MDIKVVSVSVSVTLSGSGSVMQRIEILRLHTFFCLCGGLVGHGQKLVIVLVL